MLAASLIADLARVALGVALVAAGVAKVAAGRAGSTRPPRSGCATVAVALPWFELAVGAAVVAGVAEPWPAAVAVGLLVVFTAWIVVQLVRGRHPPCACFGALSAAPLSWWHVARNGA